MSEETPTDAEDRMQIDKVPVFETVPDLDAALQKTPEACFSDRAAVPKPAPAAVPEPPASKRWGPRPSVADQATRMPDTVRLGIRRTIVLCISQTPDLETYNGVQARASQQNPTAAIFESEKNFHNGEYHCCMTYADIEYEQLI